MVSLFGPKCSRCGERVPSDASFCPNCGEPQPGGLQKCPGCQAEVRADDRFCPSCQMQLRTSVRPVLDDRRWAKDEDDFAARVDVDDVPGYFRREVVVEAGTRALLLEDGRIEAGEAGPGKLTLQSTGLTGRKRATAILVDAADVVMPFTVRDLYTRDPLRVTVDVQLSAVVQNAVSFFVNMMRGSRTYPRAKLQLMLYDEIQNAVAEAVAQYGVAELQTTFDLKQRLTTVIQRHLEATFQRAGLKFSGVRAVAVRAEPWDKLREQQEEFFLGLTEAEARKEGVKRLADVEGAIELDEIVRETARVAVTEQRNQVLERARRAAMADRMAELTGSDEFEAFLRDQDKRRLLRDEQYTALVRAFGEEREDHDLRRRYVVRTAEIEQRKELDRLELAAEEELLAIRLRHREQELEAALLLERKEAVERARLRNDVRRIALEGEHQEVVEAGRRKKAEVQAQLDATRDEVERERLLSELRVVVAENEARIKRIEIETSRLDLEMQIHVSNIKQLNDQAIRIRDMQAELDAEERRLMMDLKVRKEDRDFELERIRLVSQAGPAALIALSGAEQARWIVALQETEAMRGMSEEQILAKAAAASPEVARAFQEKFKAVADGAAGVEARERLERMLALQREGTDRALSAQEHMLAMMKELAETTIRAQGDTAKGVAEATSMSSVVVPLPGPGLAVTPGPSHAGASHPQSLRVVVCPNCHIEVNVGTKYCPQCGHQFFE